MADATIRLDVDAAPLVAALESLAELAERCPERVRRFLDGVDLASQLCRVDSDLGPAVPAGQCGVTFQPSDLLVEFLAAARASEGDGLPVDIEFHGRPFRSE